MYEQHAQTQPVEQRREHQQTMLRALVERVATVSPLHRAQLADVAAGDLTLDNLHEVPVVTKADLWAHYPLGALAVPRDQLRRIHATSGTSGRATIVAYTADDLSLFRRMNARALDGASVGPGTMVHNAYGYGLFTGGLGLHGGIEEIGACAVPVSGGMTSRQVTLIRDLRPEVLLCTPSYAATIADGLAAEEIGPGENSLRVGIFGAEPWSEGMRHHLQQQLGLVALDIYGLCEILGPGIGYETPSSQGRLFVNEDEFLVECVDPVTGKPCGEGDVGELVFTTLTKQALPLVRYRTGDLASLQRIEDPEGRTMVTMSRILGRRDDMLVIRGVNVYPSEIEAVLLADERVSTAYTIVVDERAHVPSLLVLAEPTEDAAAQREPIHDDLTHGLKDRLGITCRVTLVDPGAVPRTEVGKAVRVLRWKPDHNPLPSLLS